jgi:hypothetical protein
VEQPRSRRGARAHQHRLRLRVHPAGDRLVQQWRYDWGDGHIRGIDIIAVQGGLVTAKLAYVKG